MATLNDWLEGARIRTLPASVAPVFAGLGVALSEGAFSWLRAFLALGVALFLQIAVNFFNDYSDGIRGTDDFRSGPPRLTGGGKATPRTVLGAALLSLAAAGMCGIILIWLCGKWWLLGAGLAAMLAAWFYTGGKRPYGYAGWGEVFVLIFFGYMATVGTVYTQTLTAPLHSWISGTAMGLIACALLMVNNIRDIPTDTQSGKRTLAVRLGDKKARKAFAAFTALPPLLLVIFLAPKYPLFLGLLAFIPWVYRINRPVQSRAKGKDLILVLKKTGLYELFFSLALLLAFLLATKIPATAPLGITGWIVGSCGLIFFLVDIAQTTLHKNSRA